MEKEKIIIAGGTGFMGREMIRYFGKAYRIIILTRELPQAKNNTNRYQVLQPEDLRQVTFIKWDGKSAGDWMNELEGAGLLINLAGRTVNCRYTKKNKKEIFDSRINPVKIIGEAIRQCSSAPLLWINASSATIYPHSIDKPNDEYSTHFHDDFSVRVCQRWEKTFFEQITPGTRKVALRMAITLGSGGVLIPYFNLLKWGLGGHQGNGKQMYSWVHIEDTCRMIEWIRDHPSIEGILNCSSPNPVTNKVFMQTLRNETQVKFGLPIYNWMLHAGAFITGSPAELVIKSRWVLPSKILESGFSFKYPHLKEALTAIISGVPVKQYRLF